MCQDCKFALADRFIVGTCPFCKFEEAKGDQCDDCGKLMNPEILIDSKCSICGNLPTTIQTDHLFLSLNTLSPKIAEFIQETSVTGKWTPNSTSISNSWLDKGLEPRCMTRDLDWGVTVPEPGLEMKRFYVWFDAPIGYMSITANYMDEWQTWWKNPENVQLYQFMGKDNVPFHTVLFPATLLGSGEKWTMLHHISTSEYLNYESGKFSKSRGTGIFGSHVKELPFLVSVWRFYLLMNRPESSDSIFKWEDFSTKISDELEPKIGNLVNRVLSFAYNKLDKKIPVCTKEELTATDLEFLEGIKTSVQKFCDLMEYTNIRKGLRAVLQICQSCNNFMQ